MSFAILYGSDPWVRADGGSTRVRALYSALEEFGVTVLFPTDETPLLPTASRRKMVKQRYLPLPLRRKRLVTDVAAQLERLGPQFVISASHALTPVAFARPPTTVWVDHLDLWSDFGRREAAQRRGLARSTSLAQARAWEHRERAERPRYCIATTASYADAAKVRDALWMPNPVPLVAATLTDPVGMRAGLLANFGYWPNRDAFNVLVGSWLPALRRQGWTVVVAGYDAETLPVVEGVDNLGSVGAIAEFYDNVDVTLAPLRLGGGMKVKVVESLAHGKPVLATPHAADGLPPELLGHLLVAPEPPADLAGALSALDFRFPLSRSLEAFQPSTFTRTARGLAERLRTGIL